MCTAEHNLVPGKLLSWTFHFLHWFEFTYTSCIWKVCQLGCYSMHVFNQALEIGLVGMSWREIKVFILQRESWQV